MLRDFEQTAPSAPNKERGYFLRARPPRLTPEELPLGYGGYLKSKLLCLSRQILQGPLLELLFVGVLSNIDIVFTELEHTVDQQSQLMGAATIPFSGPKREHIRRQNAPRALWLLSKLRAQMHNTSRTRLADWRVRL